MGKTIVMVTHDRRAAEHSAQIGRQIQSYNARDTTAHISLVS